MKFSNCSHLIGVESSIHGDEAPWERDFVYNKACVTTFISNVIISFDKSSYERIGLNAGTEGVTEGQTNVYVEIVMCYLDKVNK